MRHGSVRTFAGNDDFKFITAGHHGAGAHAEAAHCHTGPIVQAEYGIAGKLLEQAIVDHALCARPSFFGRLKNKVHGAVKLPRFGQIARGSEQHGGVTIMTAGVHFAVMLRGMGEGIVFL